MNYSDQFWSNQISVLLCKAPTPNTSMIYGFASPGEPLFMDLRAPGKHIPKYFNEYNNETWKHF